MIQSFHTSRDRKRRRKGATAVEVAFVMPVFIVFVFILIEYGHMLWINNMLSAASRNAARLGTTEGATNAQVEQYVRNFMRGTCDTDDLQITIRDASIFDSDEEMPQSQSDFEDLPNITLDTAGTRQLFVVRVDLNFGNAAFLPFPGVDRINLFGQSIMRHE